LENGTEETFKIGEGDFEMIKVCHLSSVHPANDTRILLKECSSLAKYYNVTLIACTDKEYCYSNVSIIPFKKINNRFIRMVFSPLKMFFEALNHKAEIYHIHDPELLITLILLKILTNAKLIYDIHEDVVSDLQSKTYLRGITRRVITAIFGEFEKNVSKLTDYNITATPFIRKKFKKFNSKTIDINNYPILNELAELHLPQKQKVCYIGNITKVRGISSIIESLEYVDAELLLAGNYNPPRYRDELITLKGWSKVTELGHINRIKMKEVLSLSNAGLVIFEPEPNHINAQPNKLFEYMSASVPIIGSRFPLWEVIVEGNNCGLLVDPQKPKELAKAIQYIFDYPEEAEIMGKNGREAVEKYYNWSNEENKLMKIYKDLCS